MGIVPPGRQKDMFWLTFTMILGVGFLMGQVLVWNVLRAQGAFRGHNVSSNLFMTFTGLHAAHLAGGLLALLYTSLGQRFRMKFESQRIRVEITAWYWHFMGVLWLAIFALLHFARGA